jgi:hypothetical protein
LKSLGLACRILLTLVEPTSFHDHKIIYSRPTLSVKERCEPPSKLARVPFKTSKRCHFTRRPGQPRLRRIDPFLFCYYIRDVPGSRLRITNRYSQALNTLGFKCRCRSSRTLLASDPRFFIQSAATTNLVTNLGYISLVRISKMLLCFREFCKPVPKSKLHARAAEPSF